MIDRAELAAFVAAHIGRHCAPDELQIVVGDHEQSAVVRVAGPLDAVVKMHRHPPNARREADTLRRWRSAGLANWLPEVMAVETGRGWLMLSTLAGRPGRAVMGTPRAEAEAEAMFEAAGRFRAGLDQIGLQPQERDPMPAQVAWTRRFEAALARAAPRVSAERLAEWQRRFDPSVFAGARRVWCHRDFGAHNWVWDPSPGNGLGVLDLGQARVDLAEVDVLKMVLDGSWGVARLQGGFLRGWGREWGEIEMRRLGGVALVWEVGSVGRGG